MAYSDYLKKYESIEEIQNRLNCFYGYINKKSSNKKIIIDITTKKLIDDTKTDDTTKELIDDTKTELTCGSYNFIENFKTYDTSLLRVDCYKTNNKIPKEFPMKYCIDFSIDILENILGYNVLFDNLQNYYSIDEYSDPNYNYLSFMFNEYIFSINVFHDTDYCNDYLLSCNVYKMINNYQIYNMIKDLHINDIKTHKNIWDISSTNFLKHKKFNEFYNKEERKLLNLLIESKNIDIMDKYSYKMKIKKQKKVLKNIRKLFID